MNVGELKALLDQYPDDMRVLYEFHSDYAEMQPCEIGVVDAVHRGGYVMRPHWSMSDDNKRRTEKFLLFPGN